MPECSPRELEELKDASGKVSLNAFLDWTGSQHPIKLNKLKIFKSFNFPSNTGK
jgi:hypothetical protein